MSTDSRKNQPPLPTCTPPPSATFAPKEVAKSSPETLPKRPQIPCNCPRKDKCSLRCYARLPTLRGPPSAPISSGNQARLEKHVRDTFNHLHSIFLDTITPTSCFRKSPGSLSLSTSSADTTTNYNYTNNIYLMNPASPTLSPSVREAQKTLILKEARFILSRARSINQDLNSFSSNDPVTGKPQSVPLVDGFARSFVVLVTDHEFLLTFLAPHYNESWAAGGDGEGEGEDNLRKLMAEFVGEVTEAEKKLKRLIGVVSTLPMVPVEVKGQEGEGQEEKGVREGMGQLMLEGKENMKK
ncbi:hypothetical protein B0T20DRAFT_346615 [Sordaria brevicollis]|uniref:Uncharacterized protein n=1 Tax=Sordaria brevicollis TaxID=83679 RepID=A0AAE0PL35_SORBR|nr:hypothetical protein B0T20DRAFT_346615 [Sordaria brevicollis]